MAHYRFLHQAVGDDPQAVAKQTLSSTCMLMYRSFRRNGVYQELDAYCDDLAQVYVQALHAFYAQG
ncbi:MULTISPECIES: hypothetical protein [Symbiopectobacterium]|uniref:hypothetical protein n=1 Tax=Symbiopectobacterium TaxID=801 RepID=UPI001A232B5C|nr:MULTISPECIES: hypothetical protein [Symbiopectobacterium]MBG6247267.1 hypothetical protein [Candidatus Symbiopectobacterium sp. PLON1]MBT9428337.1 hypothetical protein [Candidatus Symbiopectobacterium endolongispinus]